jgi:hypothetical protein
MAAVDSDEVMRNIEAFFSSTGEQVDVITESSVYPITINMGTENFQINVRILKTAQPAWLLQSDVPFLFETTNEISYQEVAKEPYTVWGEVTFNENILYFMPLSDTSDAEPPIVTELIGMFQSETIFDTEGIEPFPTPTTPTTPTTPPTPTTPTTPLGPKLASGPLLSPSRTISPKPPALKTVFLLSPESPRTFEERGATVSEMHTFKKFRIEKYKLNQFSRESFKVAKQRAYDRKIADKEEVKAILSRIDSLTPMKTLFANYIAKLKIKSITPKLRRIIYNLDKTTDEQIYDLLFPILKNEDDLTNPDDLLQKISSATAHANKNLKSIAKRANIEKLLELDEAAAEAAEATGGN